VDGKTTMRTVLMIAFYFPPVGGLAAAGSQRALRFSRHLPAQGWRPVILTGRESSYSSYLTMDPDLLVGVPDTIRIVRTPVLRGLVPLLRLKGAISRLAQRRGPEPTTAPSGGTPVALPGRSASSYQRWKDAFTDLFEIPDDEIGWFVPAVLAGVRAVRRYGVDVIYSTARPWTALLVGLAIKRLTGRPLAVDFRDPWMTNPFRREYSPFRNRLEHMLERRVVEGADLLVANTEHLRDEFIARFGDRVRLKCVTIPNGFDPAEFAGVAATESRSDSDQPFRLTHTGFLYGKRDPRPVLDGIKLLHDRGMMQPGQLRCELIGPVELPYDLASYLQSNGLEHAVVPRGPVPHAESLAHLAACDIALLLQPGTDTQIPSKLFEYIGMRKRVLTIARKGSAVAQLVTENGLGEVADADDVEGIAQAIHRSYCSWKQGSTDPALPVETMVRFDVRAQVGNLSAEMAQLVG